MTDPQRTAHRYAACFCEENVWHLAAEAGLDAVDRTVAFISNRAQTCPVWAQRSAPKPGEPTIWDYHVVLIGRPAAAPDYAVWDLDSVLPFPTAFGTYVARALVPALALPTRYHPKFRLLSAEEYLAGFDSDRSHMRNVDGTWSAAPPPWPAIRSPQPTVTLSAAMDFRRSSPGTIVALDDLIARFGGLRVGQTGG